MSSLVGRESELARLSHALGSPGTLVLVAGEGGVGKSRLVREAIDAVAPNRRVAWGRPEQVTKPGPFALTIDLLQNMVDSSTASDTAREAQATLSLLNAPNVASNALPVRRIAAEIRGLLSMLGPAPIAVFEDLHIADEASQAILVHLARSAPEDGHLLVGTFRSDDVELNEGLGRFLEVVTRERLGVEIVLSPLGRVASARLARELLRGANDSTVERIAELSEGNPFFIEELASAHSTAIKALPQSISRVVLARRSRLGPVANHLISAAALMSGSLDVDVLTSACELDPSTVGRALTESIRAGMLEARQDRIVFRHALIREAVREELVAPEAQELNRRIATSIELIHKEDLDAHALALAHHWYWARDRQQAMNWALKAGQRALGYAATAEAQRAFELAVACVDGEAPPEALLGLAEVEIREGSSGNAEELLMRAAAGFKIRGQLDDAASALGRVAWVRTVMQSEDPAQAIDMALEIVENSGSTHHRARLLAQKGQIYIHRLGLLSEGRALLEEALEMASHTGDSTVQAECLDALAWESEYDRRPIDADDRAQQATLHAMQSSSAETIGRTFNNRALLLTLHGRGLEALDLLEAARRHLSKSFGVSGLAVIDLTEAIARWRMGQPSEVARLVAARVNVWAHWRGYARILEAWSASQLGDARRAERITGVHWSEVDVDRVAVIEGRQSVDDDSFEAAICEMLVAVEEQRSSSHELAQSMLAFSREKPADDHLFAASLAARAYALSGEDILAQDVLDELFGELSRYQSPYFRGMGLETRGLLALKESRHREGIELLQQSIEAFESCGNDVDRARLMRLLGSACAGDNRDEAIRLGQMAREIAMSRSSAAEIARSEAFLRSLGLRPRAGRPRKKPNSEGLLSTREQEIAALVAAGATNAEIGAKLYLSDRTVQDHIKHAFRKIGASGRAGLAAWAAKNGLV